MIVYLSMIVWILIVGAVSRKHYELNLITGRNEIRSSKVTMFLSMFYIVFFIGLRSAGSDTHAYISSYKSCATGWDALFEVIKGGFDESSSPGFGALEILIKTLFGDSYHVWLFFLAFVSGMAVARTIRKHTEYFTEAMVLFMLMGMYSWMINGVRQFVAVSLSFAAIDKIIQKKWLSYIIIILLLATIHKSVIVMIPIYFIVTGEAWNKRTVLMIFAGILAVMFTGYTTNLWGDVMTSAGYSQETYEFDDGSNIIRTLIYAVPPIMAYIYREDIARFTTPVINICINMSIMAAVLSLVANITSGVLMGRMPIYFSVYNLILLPWLVNHLPTESLRKNVNLAMYALYFLLSLIEGYGYYYSDLLFGGKVIY